MPWKANRAREVLRVLDNSPVCIERVTEVNNQPTVVFYCSTLATTLKSPCELRSCVLWVSHREWMNCAGAYAALKSAKAGERLAVKTTPKKEHTILQQDLDGRLSFIDLAMLYRVSRQRVERAIGKGHEAVTTLSPTLAVEEVSSTETPKTVSVGYGTASELGLLVCVACEEVIDAFDKYTRVDVVFGRQGAVWCSPECRQELPPMAWKLTNTYHRHWVEAVHMLADNGGLRAVKEAVGGRRRLKKLLAVMAAQGFEVPASLKPAPTKATTAQPPVVRAPAPT